MPELPEVETIRRSLEKYVVGKEIRNVEILLPRQIKWPEPDVFVARVLHTKIANLGRVGKYLLVNLDNGVSVIFHLRMTGQLIYRAADAPEDSHHVRFAVDFDDGSKLIFSDTRTFGTIYAMREDELWRIQGLAEMGPEPLSDRFTKEYLIDMAAGKKTRIKSFLLDQTIIGGLGNIYVDEALFLAHVHPMRPAGSLSEDECAELHAAINKVIADGIEDGGTTFRDYRDGDGKKGSHQENLYVYGRDGQPCRVCGEIIEKTKVGGRGTRFCPHCQPLNPPGEAGDVPNMKIIGLTGGIASGKSTVSKLLQEKGYAVLDADKVAWELAEPEKPLWEAYVNRYGEKVLHEDRTLNRQAVAEIVFQDPAEKQWMDEATHPLIKKVFEKEIKALAENGCSVVFLDVPLLYEAGWEKMAQQVWVVYANKQRQVQRICQRNGLTKAEARQRMENQLPLAEKKWRADVVIDNNGTLEDLQAQVERLLAQI